MSLDMVFVLYIFCASGFVFSQSPLSDGNHNVTLCEKDLVNITCDEMSLILINDVQYGPPVYKNGATEDTISAVLDKEMNIKSRTEEMCNGTHFCFINNTRNEFTTTRKYMPRLTNIMYKCEYEYKGCFKDDAIRLLGGVNVLNRRDMTARTCFIFCSQGRNSYTYFGTENANECFCGNGDKLYTSIYVMKTDSVCNAPCSGNPNEMCGRHGYISVYRTFYTDMKVRYKTNLEATKIKALSCDFAANAIDIRVISIQRYRECDVYLQNKVPSANSCDEEKCMDALPNQYLTDFLTDGNLHVIPQYARINFSCIPLDIFEDSSTLGADGTSSSTIIVIGACLGVLVPCIVILIICLIRRRKAKKGKNAESTTNHKSSGAKFTNKEGDEHVYFNSNADMHEDQTYENSPRPPVDDSTDHIYQISAKHKKFKSRTDESLNISTHQELRHSTSSDQYADQAEGVYDRANQIQYKTKDGEQAIYSHAVEDVYDSAEVHSRPKPREGGDSYDQFSSRT